MVRGIGGYDYPEYNGHPLVISHKTLRNFRKPYIVQEIPKIIPIYANLSELKNKLTKLEQRISDSKELKTIFDVDGFELPIDDDIENMMDEVESLTARIATMQAHDDFVLKNGFVVMNFWSHYDSKPIWYSHFMMVSNETNTMIAIFSSNDTMTFTLHGINWQIRLITVYRDGNDCTVPFIYQTPPE
jgi:hypothetical protein